MTTKKKNLAAKDAYMELIRQFPLKPISSEAMLDEASVVVDTLLDGKRLPRGAQDYLSVLTQLIENYEDEHHAIDEQLTDGEMTKHLMEAKDVRAVQVAHETGILESTLSAVINEKRCLTRQQIGSLANYFGVDPGVFSCPLLDS